MRVLERTENRHYISFPELEASEWKPFGRDVFFRDKEFLTEAMYNEIKQFYPDKVRVESGEIDFSSIKDGSHVAVEYEDSRVFCGFFVNKNNGCFVMSRLDSEFPIGFYRKDVKKITIYKEGDQ
jgi:hypothetical protein